MSPVGVPFARPIEEIGKQKGFGQAAACETYTTRVDWSCKKQFNFHRVPSLDL